MHLALHRGESARHEGDLCYRAAPSGRAHLRSAPLAPALLPSWWELFFPWEKPSPWVSPCSLQTFPLNLYLSPFGGAGQGERSLGVAEAAG